MAAHYDSYDYPSYWEDRSYEHGCEVIAIKAFLAKIPKIKNILEIGAGFGRLTPSYLFRAKKIFLSDPSNKHLAIARKSFPNQNIEFLHSSLENLPNQVRAGSIDLAIMVRVLHHIADINLAFKIINKLLSKNGYFILEFANKGNFKSTVQQFFKGNLVYPMELETLDKRTLRNIKKGTLPFLNFHPDYIASALKENGFTILEKRSVSNIRGAFLKKLFPTEFLLSVSKLVQRPLAYLNFGPSIFILATKKD